MKFNSWLIKLLAITFCFHLPVEASQNPSICHRASYPCKNNLKAGTSTFHGYLCINYSFRGSYKQSIPGRGAMELVTTTRPKEFSEGAVRKFKHLWTLETLCTALSGLWTWYCLDKTLTLKNIVLPLTTLFCDSVSSLVSQRTQPVPTY